MKKLDYKIFLVYFLIISNIIFVNFIGFKHFSNITNNIINPIFWIIIFFISNYIYNDNKQRISHKKNKTQTVFIVILIYLMVYFIQGLFFGYAKSPYNRSIIGILTNLWSYVLIIIYQEYARNILTRNSSKILTFIIFTIIEINLYAFFQITDAITLFKQISSVVLPSIASNLLLVYLTSTSGIIVCLFYKIPLILANYLLPIFPDIDWYFISIEQTILPFIAYLSIKNINDKKLNVKIRRDQLKKKNRMSVIAILMLLIFICFVAGIFKYKPVSVMSNSMYPIFKRGDIVITEKISGEISKNIKKYDIIEYILDDIIVMHRIIAIEKHGDKVLYITKGDNNNTVDKKKVKPEQVIGIIKFKVPVLGYPSVWLNEFLNKKQTLVETGK